MDKKQIKNGFLKGKTKAKKQNRKKRSTFRQAFGGNKIDKKTSKIAGKLPFWAFLQNTRQKHRQQKTKPPKSKKKTYQKRPFCILANNPYFW